MSESQRIVGYDLARGLAVFGMVLVNFKFVMGLDGAGNGWLAWATGFFDGRAAATFVTLAGIGVSLLSRRARDSRDPVQFWACRKVLLKRAIFLLILGFFDTFVWAGDILHFYAVYLAVAAVLLDASDAELWAFSGLSIALFVGLFLLLDYEKGWKGDLVYAGLWSPNGFLRHLFFNGFHPVFPWISFLLIGMVLGRRDWSSPRSQWRLFAAGAGTALAAELASRVLTAWVLSDGGEDAEWCALLFGADSMPPTPFYIAAGGGTAVAAIALCLIAARRFHVSSWLEPFAAAGQFALTLYAAHVLLGLALFDRLGWTKGRTLGFSVACSFIFYAAALLSAWFLQRRFGRGPIERLMRWSAG